MEKYKLAYRAGPLVDLELPRQVLANALRTGEVEAILQEVRRGARDAIAQGADTILLGCGLLNIIAATHGLQEVDGAPIVDVTGVLLKTAESMVHLRRVTGLRTSRVGYFSRPPTSMVDETLALYGRGWHAPQEASS